MKIMLKNYNNPIMNNIQISDGCWQDLNDVYSLITELGYGILKEDFEKIFCYYLEAKNHFVLIASVDKEICGCLSLVMYKHFFINKYRSRIESLVVSEKFRRLGIGEKLLSEAEKVARKNASGVIEVTSRKEIALCGALNFYKKNGYSNFGDREQIYLRKELF